MIQAQRKIQKWVLKDFLEFCVTSLVLTLQLLLQLHHVKVACVQKSVCPLNQLSIHKTFQMSLQILKTKKNRHVPIWSLKDNNGLLHHQVCYHVSVSKAGKRSTLTRECKLCKELGKKGILLDTIAWLVVKQLLTVARILITLIGIASKSTLREFNGAAIDDEFEELGLSFF